MVDGLPQRDAFPKESFGLAWIVDYRLWTIDYGLSTVDYRLSTIDYGLSTINYICDVQQEPYETLPNSPRSPAMCTTR